MTNGKRALVTGSSRGIGRAIAVGLAQDGYEILVHCAGNRAKAEETQAIIEHAGGAAAVLQADLRPRHHRQQSGAGGHLYRPEYGGDGRPRLCPAGDRFHSGGLLRHAGGLRGRGAAAVRSGGTVYHRTEPLCGRGQKYSVSPGAAHSGRRSSCSTSNRKMPGQLPMKLPGHFHRLSVTAPAPG